MCHRWGSIFKKSSVNPQRVNCGHMTSPKVTIHFWLITFDRSVIQAWKQHHCVSIVHTDRMICNMTYLGQVMTLTWGQISFFTFFGHIIHHSTRPEELNTMVVKPVRRLLGEQRTGAKEPNELLSLKLATKFEHDRPSGFQDIARGFWRRCACGTCARANASPSG